MNRLRAKQAAVGVSMLALVVGLAPEAQAQVTPRDPDASSEQQANDIVVTGVRSSLNTAQELKRNSDQIVDSIQAQDIGKLPDANTVESLQRITGVQIQRRYGEGGTDVDHRTQPAIAIRGLTQVRTLIDGRDTYSASGGRNFDIEALPPELLAGIDVYKNPSAEVIEGGIGGIVNLRTRLPFDQKGQVINLNGRVNYYDLADKAGGSVSGLYSNRWNVGGGEIGLLLNGVYSKSQYRQDAVLVLPYFDLPTGAIAGAPTGARAPGGFQIYDELGSRERMTLAGAFQWRFNDALTLTLQGLHSDYKFDRVGRYFYNTTHGQNPIPLAGASFTYSGDGRVTSGAYGNAVFESARYDQALTSKNSNFAGKLEWRLSDTITSSFDAQYLKSSYDVDGNGFVLSQYTDTTELPSVAPNRSIVDFDLRGSKPRWNVRNPALLTDPNRYRFAYLADYLTRNDSDQLALRYDVKWAPIDSFVKSIAAGVRYAESNLTLRGYGDGFCTFTDGNRASCGPNGSNYIPYTANRSGFVTSGPAKGFFEGQTLSGVVYPDFPKGGSLSDNLTKTYAEFGAVRRLRFNPAEVNDQSEQTLTGYVSGAFDVTVMGLPVDGALGLRVVRTKTTSNGYIFPSDPTIDPTDAAQLQAISVGRTYTEALPSVNLRAKFTEKLQMRLAFAKAMARPDFTQMATNVNLGPPGVRTIPDPRDPNTSNPNLLPSGGSGNPFLDPIRSNQYDASLEWYFARAGSLTAGAFYKDVTGFFASGRDIRNFGGIDYSIGTTVNLGAGKIKGFELAYQQFYDFLPGVLSGLGFQANYTFVDSSVTNPFSRPGSTVPSRVPLEKLSKHSFNLVGLYEKGPVSARLAYNWRGRYLDTTQGSGANGQPQMQAPYASLDASISYNVTSHLALTLEAVNINNRMNRTYIGVPSEPLQYTLNDRRFGLSARATF